MELTERNRRWKALAVAIAAFYICGCGYYSTTGRTAGDIKQIAVPYLKNETPEPEIEIEITERIIDGLVKDNTLKVVSEEGADAVLEGSVIEYSNVPFTFGTNPQAEQTTIQAEQYRLLIKLNVSLFNRNENTYIWQNKEISAHGDYYVETTTEQNYEKALSEVYSVIVDSILSSTVQEW